MIDSCCCTLIFHSRVCQKMIVIVSFQRDQGRLDFSCLSFIYFLSSRMLPAPCRGIGVGYIYPRLAVQKAQQWDKASRQRSWKRKNDMFATRCIEYPHRCPVLLQVLFFPTLLCSLDLFWQRNKQICLLPQWHEIQICLCITPSVHIRATNMWPVIAYFIKGLKNVGI
jgi:hypothetical protein